MSQGLTPGVLGAPEPRMYQRSGYFLVVNISAPQVASSKDLGNATINGGQENNPVDTEQYQDE